MWKTLLTGALLFGTNALADDGYDATKDQKSPYIFGWMHQSSPDFKLRGGTTTGVPVTLATEASEAWGALRAEGLTNLERDRAAILAMAGDYRVSFDFLETEVYGEQTEPGTPYRSWATERVIVLEDSEELISLQHIIVMFFIDDAGETQGPMMVKHWRQDWRYEPESALEFIGERQWVNRPLDDAERAGQWQQIVYQVDDGPRYAMHGEWTHNANYSAWETRNAWRPLPRREHSIRSDYGALVGTNRITIVPNGWVHHQDNVKTVLSAPGVVDEANPALAREIGLNRYEHIVDFDFSMAETYWEKTADFWALTRDAWATHLSQSDTVKVSKTCDGESLYMGLFGAAAKVEEGKMKSEKAQKKAIGKLLGCVVTAVTPE